MYLGMQVKKRQIILRDGNAVFTLKCVVHLRSRATLRIDFTFESVRGQELVENIGTAIPNMATMNWNLSTSQQQIVAEPQI
jgi:hypothetical protein